MPRLYVDRATLMNFLHRLEEGFAHPGRVYLVGETTQVFEGWTDRMRRLEFFAEISEDERVRFNQITNNLQEEMEMDVFEESPANVIPLPAGYEERARSGGDGWGGPLAIYHFDPYSIAIRLITRGDEPDYHTVLAFLRHGWITLEKMEVLLAELLPRFSTETIAQDPAEFRRKYRGLLQMWRAGQTE
ncbi:MAG TPA: hypothetical protein VI451_04735 [Anaerolineales bacterium]|nr:hypothetical protein [Anaerolineales bacterium]